MKRIYWLILALIVIALAIYFNRSYAHIYDTITMVNLTAPEHETGYALGNVFKAKDTIYVALGDSLTAGVGLEQYEDSYPYLVANKLTAQFEGVTLVPLASPGARTIDLGTGLLDQAIKAQPKIVTILIGINDVHGSVSLGEFSKNYEHLLNRLTQETSATIYTISIPYIGDKTLIHWPYSTYFNWRIKQFNQEIKNLATRYQVQYLDLYTPAFADFQNMSPNYAADHFHPSAVGYTIWANLIYDHLHQ